MTRFEHTDRDGFAVRILIDDKGKVRAEADVSGGSGTSWYPCSVDRIVPDLVALIEADRQRAAAIVEQRRMAESCLDAINDFATRIEAGLPPKVGI